MRCRAPGTSFGFRDGYQHPEKREDIRPALHLVDDDQPLQWPERQLGLGGACQVVGVFQVESMTRPLEQLGME
jgi:hypothetical protein